jgi:hypothetical protein
MKNLSEQKNNRSKQNSGTLPMTVGYDNAQKQ